MKSYPKNKVYNKLVRDRIPEIIEKDNLEVVTQYLSKDEVLVHLKTKLLEEGNELIEAESTEDIVVEAADVLEVLYSILNELNIDVKEVEEVRKARAEKRGGFAKRIFLVETKERV